MLGDSDIKGNYAISVSTADFPKGMYFVKIM
ncbi:MAG: hypothetical protein KA974_08140 [Saprospiraceae bacterium]|nr:hypothetical protein [Saprospiraceae bacterium]